MALPAHLAAFAKASNRTSADVSGSAGFPGGKRPALPLPRLRRRSGLPRLAYTPGEMAGLRNEATGRALRGHQRHA